MKKIFFCLILFISIIFPHQIYAFTPLGNIQTQVKAQVGQYYLNIFGYVSPYASIVMTSNKTFLKSTTADSKGNFSMSGVSIRSGLSGFCLEAVDFKKVGDSKTCLSFPAEQGSVTKRDLFLPPTIGLARKQVVQGSNASIFGYSMPKAKVSVHISSGQVLGAQSDATGYYQVTLTSVKKGKYLLYSTANLNNKPSLDPINRVQLEALSGAGAVGQTAKHFFTSISLIVCIIFSVLILIIILLLILFWRRKKHADNSKQQYNGDNDQQTQQS